jgi:hypothetical protein
MKFDLACRSLTLADRCSTESFSESSSYEVSTSLAAVLTSPRS